MALPLVLQEELNDLQTDKPWSKRASVTPRRTYSAESSIVYKRSLHKWRLSDLERVARSMGADEYGTPIDTTVGQLIWLRLMQTIRTMTLKMLAGIVKDAIPAFAIEGLYQLVHDTGRSIIDNSGWTDATRAGIETAFQEFMARLLNGMRGAE